MAISSDHPSSPRWLDWLIRRRRATAVALAALAVLLIGTAAWFGLQLDEEARLGFGPDWDYWPQALGGFLLGLIAAGAGLWLWLAEDPQASAGNVRLLVLAAGGLAGLVVALAAVGWALMWRRDVFSGGMEAWQGPNAWRFWVFVGVELAGLALIFVSLLPARREERSSALLRRLVYGYNAVLNGLLLLAILLLGNILVFAWFPTTFQWSEGRGMYDLSPRTKNVLRNLKEPVTVYVILSRKLLLYQEARLVLDNCQAVTDKLRVRMVSPDLEASEVASLKALYPGENIQRGLLLVSGVPQAGKSANTAFIPEDKLAAIERDPRGNRSVEFKVEDALASELSFLAVSKKKPKIYFTQDNDEPRLADGRTDNGLAMFKNHLVRNNFEVAGLRLRKAIPGVTGPGVTDSESVPADASVVVIVNPLRPFAPAAAKALGNYLRRQGKLLVLLDFNDRNLRNLAAPVTGLETLLGEYNVGADRACLMRAPRSGQDNPLAVVGFSPEDSGNKLAQALSGQPLILVLARPLQLLRSGASHHAAAVLQTDPDREYVWVERDLHCVLNPLEWYNDLVQSRQIITRVSRTPIPLAAAVTDTKDDTPRLVVVGNARLAGNRAIDGRPLGADFLTSSLHWLLGRAGPLGISPLKTREFRLNTAAVNTSRMIFLPLFLMAVGVIGLGAGIWVVRRR